MRRLLTAFMFTWVALIYGCSKDGADKPSPYASIEPKAGAPAADFLYRDIDEAPFRLSDQRGKAVVLYFWRMKCKECKEELPGLEAFYRAYKARGLVVVAVGADTMHSAPIEDVRAFIAKNGLTFVNIRDSEGYVSEAFSVLRAPTVFVIDKKGNIARIKEGATDWASPENAAFVESLLK
ncbi:MAG: TlpA family protein disulfide reductase [Deltaproteobacteria bacterium]|nr:TlpA family protein disulfide reductase [Deltaproteobacteria bacterium]